MAAFSDFSGACYTYCLTHREVYEKSARLMLCFAGQWRNRLPDTHLGWPHQFSSTHFHWAQGCSVCELYWFVETAHRWDTGQCCHLAKGLAFCRGSHVLFSCSFDRTVKTWNVDEMTYVETL